jgi:hypothetical protein
MLEEACSSLGGQKANREEEINVSISSLKGYPQ